MHTGGDGGVVSMSLRLQGVGMVVKCSNLVTGLDFFLFTSLFRLKINVLYYMATIAPREGKMGQILCCDWLSPYISPGLSLSTDGRRNSSPTASIKVSSFHPKIKVI